MTTGHFESVPISFIWVDRDKRQRKELKSIPELAQSIRQVGLINPPVVKRDGELVAGERRWTAIRSLGWTHLPVQWEDELDPTQLHLLELEENVQREQLPWQDECAAVAEYHRLRLSLDPAWTTTLTAQYLGSTVPTVSEKLKVARGLEAGDERVVNAPKYSTAIGIVRRTEERKTASIVAGLKASVSGPAAVSEPARTVPLLNEDFHEWSASYTGQPFNFIHCDFPYGVGADGHNQGQAAAMGGYADSVEVYWDLVNTLGRAMDNVVHSSAHLMFWFSMDYYHETLVALIDIGWKVNPFPLVWLKNDNTGILPDPNRGPRRIYETAFMASRGDRKIVRAKSNAFAWPGKDKSIHMSEKPVPMLKHFMEMFVDEYSFVLDPTAGSANSLKAASALGAGRILGLERDEEFFNRAKEAYFDE